MKKNNEFLKAVLVCIISVFGLFVLGNVLNAGFHGGFRYGRFMDVVEMDIRLTEGNENFRLDGCLDYLGMQGVIHSAYGYDFEISRARGY